jgi:undecaprenyl-diphosphatase
MLAHVDAAPVALALPAEFRSPRPEQGFWLLRHRRRAGERMDYRLEQIINGPTGSHPALDSLMRQTAIWAEPIFIAIVIGWFLVGWLRGLPFERRGAIAALLAAGGSLAVNQVITHIWSRDRPFVAHPGTVHLLHGHAADASFPSDHASAAFAIAMVILLTHRRVGICALLGAAFLCYARVYSGIHYPADVLAGAIIGITVAILVSRYLGRFVAWLNDRFDKIVTWLHLPLPVQRESGPAK